MKTLIRKIVFWAMCCGISLGSLSVLAAPQWTKSSAVYTVESGWGTDSYSVRLVTDSSSSIYTNPAGCAFPQSGYVTLPTDTGRRLYQDQLRDAFNSGRKVKLLISDTDCPFSKPRIISVFQCNAPVGSGLSC